MEIKQVFALLLSTVLGLASCAQESLPRTLSLGKIAAAGSLAKKIKSLKVVDVEVELQEDEALYYDDLVHFLCGIQLEKGEKLVLLIDEFPQTISNILGRDIDNASAEFEFQPRLLRLPSFHHEGHSRCESKKLPV